ncbi:MAG: 7-cyano-7-deazaguanine synthase QueC [Dysgonamonadaceae bacterium]|nr:7-cyano-7-deazaguanine synthase QueC [Dysgonamonadaceae bacterium]
MAKQATKNNRNSAIVLLSGGQDSTTCLFWAMQKFQSIRTLCISYGQRHFLEVNVARKIAEQAKIPFQIIDAPFIGKMTDNSLTNTNIEMDAQKPDNEYPNTFVPGRNLFFLTTAAVIARTHQINNIVTGVSQADYSGYPDCRNNFILSANTTINLAMDEQFTIHTPLMWFSKAETWEMADRLGVLEIVQTQTLTCYNGIIADGCGNCPACKLRKTGLEKYLSSKHNRMQ